METGNLTPLHRIAKLSWACCSRANKSFAIEPTELTSPGGAEDVDGDFFQSTIVRAIGRQEADQLWESLGEHVDAVDAFGNTPLHYACQGNQLLEPVRLVRWLLSVGANPNAVNAHSETPLHFAARKGLGEISEVLLKSGASLYCIDNLGGTPLFDGLNGRYTSATEELFHDWMTSHVPALKWLCRLVIVKSLGGGSAFVTKVDNLPLPTRLRGFIGGPDYQERAETLRKAKQDKEARDTCSQS